MTASLGRVLAHHMAANEVALIRTEFKRLQIY